MRVDLENRCQSLQEELDFRKNVFEEVRPGRPAGALRQPEDTGLSPAQVWGAGGTRGGSFCLCQPGGPRAPLQPCLSSRGLSASHPDTRHWVWGPPT